MKWNLTIIRPRGFQHSSGFNEEADSVAWSLCQLGHEATITHNWFSKDSINLIFGAELLAPNQPEMLPPGTILYNLEQWTHPAMPKVVAIAQVTKATVWDYSLGNVQRWHEQGIYARHVPIGYTPNLTRIPKSEVQDIDVLFLGWMTSRRERIISELRESGLNVVTSSNCYGGGRDNLISRAKVCLNIHHDGRDQFEIVRVSYYLANGKCVLTEQSLDCLEYADLDQTAIYSSYENLVTIAKAAIKDWHEFKAFENHALDEFSKRDFTAIIRKALTELTPQEKVAHRFELAKRSGDMKDYVEWIAAHAKGTCMEIGVRDGASTSAFLSGLEKSGQGVLLSVDTAPCGHHFAGHPQWKFLQCSSQSPKLKVPQINVLLVDGDHSREGYRADLERFYPLVKPSGLILSHDIAPNPSITMEATGDPERPSKFIRDEYFAFAEKHGLRHEEIRGENGLGVFAKSEVIESDESWQASEAILQ